MGITPKEAVARVSRVFDALNAGDAAAAAALMHPHVRWPGIADTRPIHGRAHFANRWAAQLSAVTVNFEPVRFAAIEDGLLVETNETVRCRASSEVNAEYHVRRRFRFRDGLIVDMWRT